MRRVLGALVLAAIAGTSAHASTEAVERGAAFLRSRQLPSGAFFFESQTADQTAEVVAALAASGGDRDAIARALDRIEPLAAERARGRAGWAGRIVAGVVAGGRDPRAFGGADLVAILAGFYDPVTGRHDEGVYGDALAKLGVLAAGESLPDRAVTYLKLQQCADGGFSHEPTCVIDPDTDTTALALSALVAAGVPRDDPTVTRARAWLIGSQDRDGGYGEPANANSTGLVLSAIAALREDPSSAAWGDPAAALRRLQHPSGGFRYRQGDATANDYATVQALPGLSGVAYPIRAVAHAPRVRPATEERDPEPGSEPSPVGSSAAARSSAMPGRSGSPTPEVIPVNPGAPADPTPSGSTLPWASPVVALVVVGAIAAWVRSRRA